MKVQNRTLTLGRNSLAAKNGRAKRNGSIHIDSNHNLETQYDSGYKGAKTANGASLVLNSCLNNEYEKFKEKCRQDEVEQKKLNTPYLEEKERQTSTLNERLTLISLKEKELDAISDSINTIEDSITTVNSNPEKHGIDAEKRPKAQFILGLCLLVPITIYLVVFYISASYSAFFKTFDSSLVIAAIFDANALQKAIQDGWLEAFFVCTIPFAFMGLGYLVHMFLKERSLGKLKVLALFLVTFIFDCILAYQIEKKIYDFDKTPISPPFDLKIAFTTVEFWAIIFAGFVVYIIWGIIFDFVMKEHENMSRISVFIKSLKEDKRNLLKKREKVSRKLSELTLLISQKNGKISELQTKIDGFIFPNRKYLLYHAEYVKGWLMAISSEIALPHEKKTALIIECETIANEHLKKHEVSTEDFENVIYTRQTTI